MGDLHCSGCLTSFPVSAAGTPTWQSLSGIARMATSLTCIDQPNFCKLDIAAGQHGALFCKLDSKKQIRHGHDGCSYANVSIPDYAIMQWPPILPLPTIQKPGSNGDAGWDISGHISYASRSLGGMLDL